MSIFGRGHEACEGVKRGERGPLQIPLSRSVCLKPFAPSTMPAAASSPVQFIAVDARTKKLKVTDEAKAVLSKVPPGPTSFCRGVS